jgi:anthranilate phosphoribosyltransferase
VLDCSDRGPRRDVVAFNAGAALVVAGRATDLRDGVELALATIESGDAAAFVSRLRDRASAQAAVAPQPEPVR